MGKKNTTKKHKFKHVETGIGARAPEAATSSVSTSKPARLAADGTSTRDFSYVGVDLRRIGVMAGALVALELVLYYLLVHTPVGTAIYSLVRV